MLAEILHFRAVIGRFVEFGVGGGLVGYGNVETAAEFDQFRFVEFFLLMRDVAPFAGLAQSVAFDGMREDDGGRAAVFDGGLVGGVDFRRIVPAAVEF